MLEAANPPGRFVWEPQINDELFNAIGEEWKKCPECIKRSPDIIKTIEKGLASLPIQWKKVTINPYKVKMMIFMTAVSRNGIAQICEAFVAAENGDYSGLAFLTMAYNQIPHMQINWADQLAKAFSADFDNTRDYLLEMEPKGSLIGAPYSKLFAIATHGGWPMLPIPNEYKKVKQSKVETLILSGSLDFSTPAKNGTKMLEYLPHGHQVILKNRGHEDMGLIQDEAYRNLVNKFFQTGEIDDTGFSDLPMDFNTVNPSFQKMGKTFYTLDRLRLSGILIKMMR